MRKFIGLCFILLFSCFSYAQSPAVNTVSLTLSWVPPIVRENGVALSVAEIGGYELRYRLKTANAFSSVVIPNGAAKSYVLAGLASGDYDVQIAAFDTDGLYSSFVVLAYKLNTSPPKPVGGFNIKQQSVNVLELCRTSTTCKVVSGDGL